MEANDLSFIAQKILNNFIHSPRLTYTQSQPEDVDNDLFKYHLNFLVTKGILLKENKYYVLTKTGQQIIHTLTSSGRIMPLHQVSVLCFVTRALNNITQTLIQERTRQPYIGDIGMIAGKILAGETVETAAKRKLLEETGLSGNFKWLGVFRVIRLDQNKELFQDTFYNICTASHPLGVLQQSTKWGNNQWISLSDFDKLQTNNHTYTINTKKLNNLLISGKSSPFMIEDQSTIFW